MESVLPTRLFFFFNDTATTEIYTLSLHDALPISVRAVCGKSKQKADNLLPPRRVLSRRRGLLTGILRSEEHTSELQSPCNLVCRLLLEKKNINFSIPPTCVSMIRSTVCARSPSTA